MVASKVYNGHGGGCIYDHVMRMDHVLDLERTNVDYCKLTVDFKLHENLVASRYWYI